MKSPRTIHGIIPGAITDQLNRIKHRSGGNDENFSEKLQSRFSSLLLACASFGIEVEAATKEELLADLVLLAHHPEICESFRRVLRHYLNANQSDRRQHSGLTLARKQRRIPGS